MLNVGCAIKDSDKRQSASADAIDTRGLAACAVSYWCINQNQEGCPNVSDNIKDFFTAGRVWKIMIGLSSEIWQIPANTFYKNNSKMRQLLLPSTIFMFRGLFIRMPKVIYIFSIIQQSRKALRHLKLKPCGCCFPESTKMCTFANSKTKFF